MSVETTPMDIRFKAEIAADGDLNRLHISKDGVKVSMTEEQAISLARVIIAKFGEEKVNG